MRLLPTTFGNYTIFVKKGGAYENLFSTLLLS